MSATITVPAAPAKSPYDEIDGFLNALVARIRDGEEIHWTAAEVAALVLLKADLEVDRLLLLGNYVAMIDEALDDAVDNMRTLDSAIRAEVVGGAS